MIASDATGKGWLAASEAALAYIPVPKVLDIIKNQDGASLEELRKTITSKNESDGLTPLQAAQYSLQLDWLSSGDCGTIETLFLARGVVNPLPGSSYFLMLTGLQARTFLQI